MLKQFGNPPFLREPPFQLNLLSLSNFFHDPPTIVQILKTRNPPTISGKEETMDGILSAMNSERFSHC